jgi:hypothetical protein
VISDADLDRESPEDEPMLLAFELVDRLRERATHRGVPPFGYQLRAVSELIYRVGADNADRSEDLVIQLESMTDYVRKNFK